MEPPWTAPLPEKPPPSPLTEKGTPPALLSSAEWEASPRHPRNWRTSSFLALTVSPLTNRAALRRRWKNALLISITGFLSTTGSSIFVPAAPLISILFPAPREVITMTTALYVLGLGFGPFVFAPISELWGRQVAYSASMVGESFS